MVMPDEDDPVRNRCEAPGSLLWSFGRPIEVPQVLDVLRVQPWFNVGEKAAIDLQAGLKTAHECQNRLAVPLVVLRPRVVTAEAEVVVAPNADCPSFCEEINSLSQAVSELEQVAEDDEAVGPLLSEDINRPPQVAQVLMNVCQDSDSHSKAFPRSVASCSDHR